jgi:hypothetical protein
MCDGKCKREQDEMEIKTIFEIESDEEFELEIGETIFEDDELLIDIDLEDEE